MPCGVEVTGVQALQSATLELSHARITAIHADPSSCAPRDGAGRAVVFGMPPHIVVDGEHGTPAFGRATHVAVDDYQHAGISVAGPAEGARSRVQLAGNAITGGWQLPSFQYGIEVGAGAVARIEDNRIAGNVCGGPACGADPINEVQGTGILLLEAPAGNEVVGNRVSGNDAGVYQAASPDCCRIAGNSITDNRYFGAVIQDGDGSTAGNTISGGRVGVGVVADAVDTTGALQGDRISGASDAPVKEIECCGFTATAVVRRR